VYGSINSASTHQAELAAIMASVFGALYAWTRESLDLLMTIDFPELIGPALPILPQLF
jgi:hypothetical protein